MTGSPPTKEPPDTKIQILIREHEHISSSLLNNREKGVTRFNLFVGLVAGALGLLGLKEGFGEKVNVWIIGGVFVLLISCGWLMLITLIRRSITTDLHLASLQSIRKAFEKEHEDLNDVIPSVNANFERTKIRYYMQNEGEGIFEQMRHLFPYTIKRYLVPHYGDLIENICWINSLVMGFGFAWLVYLHCSEEQPAVIFGFIFVFLLSWFIQMMFVCYKHSIDKSVKGRLERKLKMERNERNNVALANRKLQQENELAKEKEKRFARATFINAIIATLVISLIYTIAFCSCVMEIIDTVFLDEEGLYLHQGFARVMGPR